MKIKIIDLLNMRARNEEMPKQIKIGDGAEIFTYDGYMYKDDGMYITDLLDFFDHLNEEVEIIEDKQIEKLGKIYDGFSDSYYDTCLVKIAQKVDEVIDVVNKLKVDD